MHWLAAIKNISHTVPNYHQNMSASAAKRQTGRNSNDLQKKTAFATIKHNESCGALVSGRIVASIRLLLMCGRMLMTLRCIPIYSALRELVKLSLWPTPFIRLSAPGHGWADVALAAGQSSASRRELVNWEIAAPGQHTRTILHVYTYTDMRSLRDGNDDNVLFLDNEANLIQLTTRINVVRGVT